MPARYFYLHGAAAGSTLAGDRRVHGTFQSPCTFAFFCPLCAEIWGLGFIPDTYAQCFTVLCERHPERAHPAQHPGFLWLPFEPEWNAELPPELLTRELRGWAQRVQDWNKWAEEI